MSMSYAEFQQQARRLALLQALEQAAQYRANAVLLKSYCEAVGHTVSSDRLEADLAWLSEQGLIGLQRGADASVAVLTDRGQDVATGRAQVPGVARPQPGA
jgi:hypothetical protein